jgi:hypothetical protein
MLLRSPKKHGISGIIEEFHKATADFTDFDPMLSQAEIFRIKSRYFHY